jgi:hypothetical protein
LLDLCCIISAVLWLESTEVTGVAHFVELREILRKKSSIGLRLLKSRLWVFARIYVHGEYLSQLTNAEDKDGILLSISKDSSPVKLFPALLESFRPSICASDPPSLSFNNVRLEIKHASNDLPGKQVALGPSI